ncbi:MAG: Crp/Fnr family transcriptional regulator [Nitrospirales bacterium]|nr:Crp/Fnr family transcriptional regulator [Nitrospirales bacterium]
MGRDLTATKTIPIFSTLTDDEIEEIYHHLIKESFKKKEEIFSEGDPPDWFYLLLSGKVKITKLSHDGREIIMELISPQDFFGGLAVLKGFPYPANAFAMEDSVVIKITRQDFLKIIERFPPVMFAIASSLGDRTRDLHDTLKNVALVRVESRIASLLLKLADKVGEKEGEMTFIGMRLTKQDIAEMVGTTVETTIRVMSRFKKAGLISDREGKVVLHDLEKLKRVVSPHFL